MGGEKINLAKDVVPPTPPIIKPLQSCGGIPPDPHDAGIACMNVGNARHQSIVRAMRVLSEHFAKSIRIEELVVVAGPASLCYITSVII